MSKAPSFHDIFRQVEIDCDGCWIATHKNDTGTGYTRIAGILAHRWSYQTFIGPIEQGKLVLHSCDKRRCINPDHLRLGTYHDNNIDMYTRGRGQAGDNHWTRRENHRISRGVTRPYAAFNREEVLEIRRRWANREFRSYRSMGRVYGVSHAVISALIKGTSYSDVE